jgi:membrane protease YdiL (CAAX protease family)
MRDFVQRHPETCFLVLAFGWAWGFWLPVAGTDMGNLAAVPPVFFLFAMLGGLGPSLAGLVVRLALPRGQRPRLLGRPDLPLFVLAALVVPAASLAALGLNRWLGLPADPGDVASRLAIGLVWPLFSSLGEEFGWRGFLLARWTRQGQFWKPALGIGLLWGLWHLPADWIGLRALGWWFIPQYLIVGLLNLTILSVIMTAILRRGQGDIRLAILFHFTITASAILLGSQGPADPARTVAATAVSIVILVLAGLPVVLALRKPPKTPSLANVARLK